MYYHRFAAAGTDVIQKQPGNSVKLKNLVFTADATGKITFTDGTLTYVVDVAVGIRRFKHELAFTPESDVTLTCAGANISVFADVYYG